MSVLSTVALLESSASEGGGVEGTPFDVGTVMIYENKKKKERQVSSCRIWNKRLFHH